jgi:pimeloyl-ACP methyl ester carboxylesterase
VSAPAALYCDRAHQLGADDGLEYFGRLVHIDALQRLYVEERGEGTPIVFVPGYGGDAALFVNLADALADEFLAITYDRRGNSRSRRGWIRVSLAEQADDLARLLDALGHERAIVMASSNGCSIALTFMLAHRERLIHGVLHEPFWSPAFVRDAASMRATVMGRMRAIQLRREKDCGGLEARLRYLGGDALVEHFTAHSRQRMGENAETGAVELSVFSQWTPSDDEWSRLRALPLTLLRGTASLPFFGESVAFFESHLACAAIAVPGGHGGFVEHPVAIAGTLRPILRRAIAEA